MANSQYRQAVKKRVRSSEYLHTKFHHATNQLFKSADEIDWSSAILINKSIGIALGMEYLETLGNGKSIMFIGLNRDQYSLIETADEFRAAVEAGTLAFKLASDSVPRCNLVTPGLNEEFDEELESDTEEY